MRARMSGDLHMRSKLFLSLALAILGVTSARFGLAQSIYSAHENHLPIAVGFGASNFDLDYGRDNSGTERRMGAITSWLDWTPPKVPRLLEGLSVEVEGRDINFGRPSSLPKMRQDTILGGVAYNLPYSHLTHPYIKYLMGMGSIDFPPAGRYSHDTRSVWAPGRAWRSSFSQTSGRTPTMNTNSGPISSGPMR